MRIRNWPRKRGPSKSAAVRLQNAWFKDANRLAKHCAASQQVAAIEMTKGTGLYPRDLLLKCMSGGIIAPITAEGRELQYRRQRVDPVAFQGFVLRLTADQNIGLSSFTPIIWPLPYRDTAGFWDVTQPDRITIPPGVTMIQMFSQHLASGAWNGQAIAQIKDPAGVSWGRGDNVGNTSHGLACGTGPIVVTPGQQFQNLAWNNVWGILQGTQQNTWFAGVVMEAT